ncbi:MAG: alkaline phosphatase family protein [Acidobacteriota bacterium]|nr:alkaline phosphatase family protein [Acidobacteriota bacterium]
MRTLSGWMRLSGALVVALSMVPSAVAAAAPKPRLLVLAVDGGGYELVQEFLRDGALPNFARLRDEGAFSDGMVTAFPSKTAASFAMIWTGLPGRETGITGNSVLALPAGSHTLLETRDGFSAALLRADPLWTRAARAGRRAVALHTTHTWPLDAALGRLGPERRGELLILTGYGDVRLPPATLDEVRNPLLTEPPAFLAGASAARRIGGSPGFFRFDVGGAAFLGVFLDDPLNPEGGWDTFGVLDDPGDGDPGPGAPIWLARVAIGSDAGFSGPISAGAEGRRVEFQVRAFAAAAPAAGSPARYLVFRGGASEMGAHPEAFWKERLGAPEWPRTVGAPEYASGRLGPTRADGGEGVAESRLLEITGAVADSALAHLDAAASLPDWDLIALYLPMADEMGHLLYGRLDERLPTHVPPLAEALRPVLAGAFAEVDRVLGQLFQLAEASGAHLMVVSDHGMSGTDRLLHLNVALERAGLLAFGADGAVDLSRTQATLLTTADGSVGINRASRPAGIVPPDQEAAVLAAVRAALLAIRADDEPVVTGFLEPVARGSVQPGGATTGDLFPLLRPGFLTSARPAEDIVMPARSSGNHGFAPTRRDMLAVLAAWGPRIPAGSEWPRASALDVVPTALDLLGLPADPTLPGRSLLGGAPLVRPTGGTPPGRQR